MSEIIQRMPTWAGVDAKDWDKVEGQKQVTLKGKPTLQPIYAKRVDASGNTMHREWNHFRIHDSGDFYSPEYADKWKQIIAKNPNINFYAYTKTLGESREPESQGAHLKVKELESLPNMKVIQSVGGKHDHLVDPDKPHAVIFESRDQAARAGYTTDSYNFDSTAADPKNKNIGLVIHGNTAGFTLKNHVARSEKLKARLAPVLPAGSEQAPDIAESPVAGNPKKARVS
jgi:hypothetical protein